MKVVGVDDSTKELITIDCLAATGCRSKNSISILRQSGSEGLVYGCTAL
jgi:hypothetical protein